MHRNPETELRNGSSFLYAKKKGRKEMSIAEKLEQLAENVPKVYESGRTAEREAFWNAYLADNSYTTYQVARFSGNGWNDTTFYPNQDLHVKYGYHWFYYNMVTNLKERLAECGVTLDFSEARDVGSMFEGAVTTELPEVDMSHVATGLQCQRLFCQCEKLVTIDKLILKMDGSNGFANSFTKCTALQNITIEGVIGQDLDIHWSPLTAESVRSILNAMTEDSTLATGKKVTFASSVQQHFFDDWTLNSDRTAKENAGWTFSFA